MPENFVYCETVLVVPSRVNLPILHPRADTMHYLYVVYLTLTDDALRIIQSWSQDSCVAENYAIQPKRYIIVDAYYNYSTLFVYQALREVI